MSESNDVAAAVVPGAGGSSSEIPPSAAAAPYWGEREIAQDQREVFEKVGAHFQGAGVDSKIGNAALAWLEQNAGKPITSSEKKHSYDLSAFNIRPDDVHAVHAFANAMHAQGASQEQLEQLYRFYDGARSAQFQKTMEEARTLARMDGEDASKAIRAMRIEWGNEYEPNMRLLRAHVSRLPAAEREKLEERNAEGVLALNDPARIRELVKAARGGSSQKSPADELAELRAMMANPRSAYWKGPDAERNQARYRDLLRSGTT